MARVEDILAALNRRNTMNRANTLTVTARVPSPGIITFQSSAEWRAHFEASKQSSKLIVMDFTASWCGPCRRIEPFIEELAANYPEVEFIKIDVDKLSQVAWQFGVHAMPTFILMKKGQELDKFVGADKDELLMKIQKYVI